jgi:hypothetical protein
MTYRAGTIKRERRTAERVEQLDQQILGVLREDHPQSVRSLTAGESTRHRQGRRGIGTSVFRHLSQILVSQLNERTLRSFARYGSWSSSLVASVGLPLALSSGYRIREVMNYASISMLSEACCNHAVENRNQ